MDKIIHKRIVELEETVERLEERVAELEIQRSLEEEYQMEQSELTE